MRCCLFVCLLGASIVLVGCPANNADDDSGDDDATGNDDSAGDDDSASSPACTDDVVDECHPPVTVTVVNVVDGDTFEVAPPVDLPDAAGTERFRLLCNDATEPGECYHDEATDCLRSLIEGETVMLYFDSDCVGVYGRGLVYVVIDGQLVNVELARAGCTVLAEPYYLNNYACCDEVLAAAQDAHSQGLGGWGACTGQSPWDVAP